MSASYFIRVIMMIAALVAVVIAIRGLSPGSMQKAMLAMGVEPGTAESPGLQPASRALGEGERSLNICRTRVHAVDFGGGQKVEEFKEGFKLRWLAFDPPADPTKPVQPTELGYLQVEKWLSLHCQIIVKPVAESAIAKDATRGPLVIRYIDRTELPITWIYGHHFEIEGQLYESQDFADALQELREIASFEKPGGP